MTKIRYCFAKGDSNSSSSSTSSSKRTICLNESNSQQSYKSSTPWYACCHYKKDIKLSESSSHVTCDKNNNNNNNHKHIKLTSSRHRIDRQPNDKCDNVLVSDIIGGFGLYQLLVLIFSGLREGTVGYDAVVTSIITQPENKFRCADFLPDFAGQE